MTWRVRLKHILATHVLPEAERDAVLLTFDDGPHPDGTPAVLEALRRHQARAVFFVVGSRVHRAPEMLKRVVEEGHILGNHSWAHPLGRQLGLVACRHDIEKCQRVVHEWTGCRPSLFRPPLGHLSPASLIAPRLAGLSPVLWSVDSEDWKLRSRDEVPVASDRLLARLSQGPLRDIVLCHDERPLTAQMLDVVLPRLIERGVNLRPAMEGLAVS